MKARHGMAGASAWCGGRGGRHAGRARGGREAGATDGGDHRGLLARAATPAAGPPPAHSEMRTGGTRWDGAITRVVDPGTSAVTTLLLAEVAHLQQNHLVSTEWHCGQWEIFLGLSSGPLLTVLHEHMWQYMD